MREPQKFPRVLTGVMVGTMLLFAGGGALGYLTYGSKIQVRAAALALLDPVCLSTLDH